MEQGADGVRLTTVDGRTTCVIGGYAEAVAALVDGRIIRPSSPGSHGSWLGDRVTAALKAATSHRQCAALEPALRTLADRYVAEVRNQGHGELVGDVVVPLVIDCLVAMVGPRPRDSEFLRHWARAYDPRAADDTPRWTALASRLEPALSAAEPGDATFAGLLATATSDGHLTAAEAARAIGVVLVSAPPSLCRLMSDTVLALLVDREKCAQVTAAPELIPAAIEEMARYATPTYHAAPRITATDTQVGGCPIPAGTPVDILLGAANRDPRQFTRPGAIDFTRPGNGHLAFGHGALYCPGAGFARTVARIGIAALLADLPAMALRTPRTELRWTTTRDPHIAMLERIDVEQT